MIVSSPPGAEVILDGGQVLGRAPVRELVSPGRHLVSFRLAGHEESSAEVSVEIGREAVLVHRLEPLPIVESSTYRGRLRDHLSRWEAGVSLGYLGTTMTEAAKLRTGVAGGGGFSFDVYGRISLIVFGGDATFTPFDDRMPESISTTGGVFSTGVEGVAVSGYLGPSVPLLARFPLFLGLYGGYATVPEGVTRKTDVPSNTVCVNCIHDNYPIAAGPFAELNAHFRSHGFGLGVGYRRMLSSRADLSSSLSIKASVYLDPVVWSLLDRLGRK